MYSSGDGEIDEVDNSNPILKGSIASSQKCLPPPDDYLANTEHQFHLHPQHRTGKSDMGDDELIYAPVGPPGTIRNEKGLYHQHLISTFGTVIPRKRPTNL